MGRFSHDVGSSNQILVVRLWEECMLTWLTGLIYYLFCWFVCLFFVFLGEDYVAQDGFKLPIPGPK